MPLSLQELEERLSAVEGTLACLEADLKDLREALGAEDVTPLDVAKGNVTLAYSVILLTHMHLQMKGCPGDHPIYRDLDRVKSYMDKVERAERGTARAREGRLNTEAASRFIKSVLGQSPAEA